jgi:hypothetical protein
MKTIMTLFGLLLSGGGAALLYFSYKRKFIKTKEGETLKDVTKQVLEGDTNAGIKQGLRMGFGVWSKAVGMAGGFFMVLLGFMLLFFSFLFRVMF